MSFPAHQTNPPGEWGVDTVDNGKTWAVVNNATLRVKRIGPVYRPRSQSNVNYFDRAMEEAGRRNELEAQASMGDYRVTLPVDPPGGPAEPTSWPFPSRKTCPEPELCTAGDACAGRCK